MARRTLAQSVKDGILNGLRSGVRPAELATQFGVSIPTVYNYRKTLNAATTTTAIPAQTIPTVGLETATAAVATKSAKRSR